MVAAEHEHDFLFLPKFSMVITHIKRLKDAEKETEQFISTVKLLGPHLGPMLIQIGDNFGPKNFPFLEEFVQQLLDDQRFFIELRHEGWFYDPFHRKAVFDLLARYQIGTVIADTPGRRDCVHMELTIPEAYIRFNGLGSDFRTFDYLRLDAWADRLKAWLHSGLEKVYFIVSQKDEVDTPALAQNSYKMEIRIILDHVTIDVSNLVPLITGVVITTIRYYRKKPKQKRLLKIREKMKIPN